MTRLLRYRWFWGVAGVILLLDQLTKIFIARFSGLPLHDPQGGWEIIPGFFRIVYSVNYGAAWGMMAGMGWLLILLAAVALIAIYAFRHALEMRQRGMQIIFGLIVGGILGNTIDRVAHGYVIDFLDFDLQFYQWPTFNVADCGIVVGICLYLLWSFRPQPRVEP
ncbi:MAG: signal peptidase II [Verrucomicrobiota bacterium JB022]|nr:signal peptidase II [Verrucomicrobiota bacterium JB022]